MVIIKQTLSHRTKDTTCISLGFILKYEDQEIRLADNLVLKNLIILESTITYTNTQASVLGNISFPLRLRKIL